MVQDKVRKRVDGFEVRNLQIFDCQNGNFELNYHDKKIEFPYNPEESTDQIVYHFESMINGGGEGLVKWQEKNNNWNLHSVVNIVKERILSLGVFEECIFSFTERTFHKNANTKNEYWDYIFYNIDKGVAQGVANVLVEDNFLKMQTKNWDSNTKNIEYIMPMSSLLNRSVKKQIFIISEFSDSNDAINKKIKDTFETMGWKCIVMNLDINIGNIDLAIDKYISESNYVIANLSYREGGYWNANVFYELGMAAAYKKKRIMFLHENQFPNAENKLPFDINSHTCEIWEQNQDQKLIDKLVSIII